jgi:hypothetical protein
MLLATDWDSHPGRFYKLVAVFEVADRPRQLAFMEMWSGAWNRRAYSCSKTFWPVKNVAEHEVLRAMYLLRVVRQSDEVDCTEPVFSGTVSSNEQIDWYVEGTVILTHTGHGHIYTYHHQ